MPAEKYFLPFVPPDLPGDSTLDFEWDDVDPYELIGDVDDALLKRLESVSFLGCLAFAAGCGGWVFRRFEGLHDMPWPMQFIENVFALLIDFDAGRAWDPPLEWEGKVLGPIKLNIANITNAINQTVSRFGPAPDAAFGSKLALFVLPERARPRFLEWQEQAIARLMQAFPITKNDRLGPSVPREVLDPTKELDGNLIYGYLQEFIDQLDVAANPFIDQLPVLQSHSRRG